MMTATEHVVEVETPPLAVSQPKLVQTGAQKCSSNGKKWFTKNQMVLGPRRRK
jgi:hypothetical protein